MVQVQSASSSVNGVRRVSETREDSVGIQYDVVCIGFGSSSISLAIALQETSPETKVLFLEQQPRSTYVPFTRLPGSFMQLSFLNDLVTLENPRSKFSYIQYLHSTAQLIRFTNLGCMQPLREQFSRYLTWCADKFEDKVCYGARVQAVRPSPKGKESSVGSWTVDYVDVESGESGMVSAKQVICAVGLQPTIPKPLQNSQISRSVFHSSECADLLQNVARDFERQYRFAVIGNCQEAAEMIEKICGMRNAHHVTWIRESSTDGQQGIDPTLDHRLYELHYTQRVSEPDPQMWSFQKHSDVSLETVRRNTDGRIHIAYTNMDASSKSMGAVCDFVIAATGYKKSEYKKIFGQVKELFQGGEFGVDRHNRVKLRQGSVHEDCGLWILGSLASVTDVSPMRRLILHR